MKYRKKPTTIDAIQWFKDVNSGKDFKIKSYAERDPLDNRVCEQCRHPMKDHGFLDRFRYGQLVCPGDYLYKLDGQVFVCKPDIFNIIWELSNDQED